MQQSPSGKDLSETESIDHFDQQSIPNHPSSNDVVKIEEEDHKSGEHNIKIYIDPIKEQDETNISEYSF